MTKLKKNRFKDIDYNLIDTYQIDEDNLVHRIFNDITFDDLIGISFDNCIFKNCKFLGKIKNCTFFNVKFEKCELSNISFINCGIHFNLFYNCHAIGVNFIDSKIKYTDFNNCHMNYSAFSFTSVEDIDLIECNMKEMRLNNVSFNKDILFDNCNLEGLEVTQTSLKDVDVRSSKLEDMRVHPNDVRGLIVNEIQAIELISLLGVVIM